MAIAPKSPGAQNNISDRKLYVRFPKKLPSEDEIKGLSPHIASVVFPRQKSARFCHIVLQSPSKVSEVLKELDRKPFGERGKLTVERPKYSNVEVKTEKKEKNLTPNNPKKNNKKSENERRRVFIRKIPGATTEEDLKKLPGCVFVKLYKFKNNKSKCSALIKFSSQNLAEEFVNNPQKYEIHGQVPVVKFANNQDVRGGKKRNGEKEVKNNEENVVKKNGEKKVGKKKGKKFSMKLVEDSTETTEEQLNVKKDSEDDNGAVTEHKPDSDEEHKPDSDEEHGEENGGDKMEDDDENDDDDDDDEDEDDVDMSD